jgi:hypothetical protein
VPIPLLQEQPVPTIDIAYINGVSVEPKGDDPDSFTLAIDMEEAGTHSTVLLRLSLLNFIILRQAVEAEARKHGIK